MTATSHPSLIPILSLVVAILAVFFGPLVARANVQRQIEVAAREAWMREFREKAAQVVAWWDAFELLKRADKANDAAMAERLDALLLAFHAMRFLVLEKGGQHAQFQEAMDRFLHSPDDQKEQHLPQIAVAVGEVLLRERAAIETDQAIIRWQPWLHLKARLARDPPHWPQQVAAAVPTSQTMPAGSGTMWGKLRTWIALDPAHKARFEMRWGLVDRLFKLVQWALTIAVVAALAKGAKGTPNQGGLILLSLALLVAWASTFLSFFSAYFRSRFPDIDRRPQFYAALITLSSVALALAIIFLAFQAFEVLVNAQINQIRK